MEWNRIESARATRDSEGTPRGGSGSGRSGFLEKCTLAHLPARNPTPLHFTPLHSMSTRLSARSSTPLHSTRLRSVHGSKLARSTHNDPPRSLSSPLFPALSRPFSGFPSLFPLITIAILKLLLLLLLLLRIPWRAFYLSICRYMYICMLGGMEQVETLLGRDRKMDFVSSRSNNMRVSVVFHGSLNSRLFRPVTLLSGYGEDNST